MASVTANSRMIYAFSRDGAMPGSKFWHQINPRTRTPTNAIWLAVVGALILAMPSLWSSAAYAAVTSIAVIGLYIAYVIPTFLRRRPATASRAGPGTSGGGAPRRVGRHRLGRLHHHPVRAADRQPDHLAQLQLHHRGRGRGARLRRDLLAGLGEELVQRARRSRARRRNWPRSSGSFPPDVGRPGARPAARPADPGAAARSRSARARSTRLCSPSPTCRAGCRASACGGVLPRRGGRTLLRGLQLPARRGRGHEHGRRVRHVVLGPRLRRLRHGAGPGHPAPASRGTTGTRPGDRRPDLAATARRCWPRRGRS